MDLVVEYIFITSTYGTSTYLEFARLEVLSTRTPNLQNPRKLTENKLLLEGQI